MLPAYAPVSVRQIHLGEQVSAIGTDRLVTIAVAWLRGSTSSRPKLKSRELRPDKRKALLYFSVLSQENFTCCLGAAGGAVSASASSPGLWF